MSSIEKAAEKLKKSVDAGNNIGSGNRKIRKDDQFAGSEQTRSAQINRARHIDDVTSKDIHPIISILERNNMLTPDLKNKNQVEEYRQIKRHVLQNARKNRAANIEQANVVMLTSALPGEGKTYSTINLAMSIASERDVSVLVVDCDVIRHSLSKYFGLENYPGLMDYLEDGERNIRDIVINTDIPSLRILPSGSSSSDSTELLASDEMQRLIDDLSSQYPDQIIILDSPPLLITSQSAILTGHAGQILVVVEEGITPQSAVLEAIGKLDKNKVIGTILNKRSRYSRDNNYGGYYYGNYGE